MHLLYLWNISVNLGVLQADLQGGSGGEYYLTLLWRRGLGTTRRQSQLADSWQDSEEATTHRARNDDDATTKGEPFKEPNIQFTGVVDREL